MQARVWGQWEVDGCSKGGMRGILAVFLTRSSPKATVFISGYEPV